MGVAVRAEFREVEQIIDRDGEGMSQQHKIKQQREISEHQGFKQNGRQKDTTGSRTPPRSIMDEGLIRLMTRDFNNPALSSEEDLAAGTLDNYQHAE